MGRFEKHTGKIREGVYPKKDGNYGPATKAKLETLVKPKPIAIKPSSELYRLITGTFESKDAAEKAAKELKEKYGWVINIKEE